MLVFEFEAIYVSVCPASHTYVHSPEAEKKKLARLLLLKEVDIPACSIFDRVGYLQHRGYVCRGSHRLGFHNYLILSSCELKGVIAFAYGAIFALVKNRL